MRWMILPALALWALVGAKPIEVLHWTGALRASIWDSDYKRGLGATGGAETHFSWGIGTVQLGYSYFESRYGYLDAVHEIEIAAGPKWEFHPSPDDPIYPRLGLHAGFSSNWEQKLHLIAGAEAEGVIPLRKRWSFFAAFQPSYSLGAHNQMFWRVALGALFDAKP